MSTTIIAAAPTTRTALRRGLTSLPRSCFATTASTSSSSPTSSSTPPARSPLRSNAAAAAVPQVNYPKTNWSDVAFSDPAPPPTHSGLTPPLPDSLFASSIKSIAIGPSSSNSTNLRHAERSLHMKLLKSGGGNQIGPRGTIRGVPFLNAEQARAVNARSSELEGGVQGQEESLASMSKRQRQQAYLEREGGDYSRFLPPSHQQQDGASEGPTPEWYKVASNVLSHNSSITPEARDSLTRQIGQLLNGQPFRGNQGSLAKVGAAKVEAPPVSQAPAAPAKKKGKK